MYRWLKDGVPVGDFSSSQFYRFHSTRREDAGSYQCIARNDAGSILSEKSEVVVACKYTHSFAGSPQSPLSFELRGVRDQSNATFLQIGGGQLNKITARAGNWTLISKQCIPQSGHQSAQVGGGQRSAIYVPISDSIVPFKGQSQELGSVVG